MEKKSVKSHNVFRSKTEVTTIKYSRTCSKSFLVNLKNMGLGIETMAWISSMLKINYNCKA